MARRQGLRSGLWGASAEARDPEGGAGSARRADPGGQREGRRDGRDLTRAGHAGAVVQRQGGRERGGLTQGVPDNFRAIAAPGSTSRRWRVFGRCVAKNPLLIVPIQSKACRNLSPQSPIFTA